MKIGILSDTHGNLPIVGKVIDLFHEHHLGAVFHCGDIGSFEVLIQLAELKVPIHAVLGNVDQFSNDWKYAPRPEGLQLHGRFGEVTLENRRIALLHSDDYSARDRAMASGEYDYIFTGHTHELHDYTVGSTRCINPGTAGRGVPNTCAVLDLRTGALQPIHLV
ncbi:metallophosphoesterase family protein [Pontiellaceae bacterium B12227]|nr:metallophosphoesterase family protein [Pontiellaceae bacterium B12227]